ncbi:polysaccharide biosynthesis C-terminal domain-containing protein [Curtobacterium sp. ZW137]|uniref:polysaccharide biosynthesis C-terminal domain-containing protein n=1 Tax=Curtobacterium sp. ZW137 TaxID=2485104 RepID=UPI000F4B85A5|nr:O-antigen/teichoic acid export membrane protein [Curtobacterium sp. ZW137]
MSSAAKGRAIRLAGYIAIPVTSGLVSLALFPTVSSLFGSLGWSSVAVGLSSGMAISVVLELGWGVTGPMRVARASARARRRIFAISIVSKAVVGLPLVLIAGILAFSVAKGYPLASAVMAAASTLGGLSSVWYFAGAGKPWIAVLTDPAGKFLYSVVAVAVGYGTHSLLAIALVMLAGSLFSPLLAIVGSGVRKRDFAKLSAGRILFVVRAQLVALGGRAATAGYISLPTVLVGVASPGSLAIFASAERLQRMTLQVLNAVPTSMQPWVGSVPLPERVRRMKIAIWASLSYGLVAGVSFALLAPIAADILFSGETPLPMHLTWLCAAVIAVTCTSRATGGIALVALGEVRSLTRSALLGAVVGLPAILILAHYLGASGAVVGEVVAEVVVLAVQLRRLIGRRRQRRTL